MLKEVSLFSLLSTCNGGFDATFPYLLDKVVATVAFSIWLMFFATKEFMGYYCVITISSCSSCQCMIISELQNKSANTTGLHFRVQNMNATNTIQKKKTNVHLGLQ